MPTYRCDKNSIDPSSNMKGDHGLLQLNDQADMAKTSKAFRICVYAQDCCQIYLIV